MFLIQTKPVIVVLSISINTVLIVLGIYMEHFIEADGGDRVQTKKNSKIHRSSYLITGTLQGLSSC